MSNYTLDFENLAAGDVVNDQYQGQGVTISSGAYNPAMVFDTENPTGGDWDLQTGNLGNVLIVSEDGDSNDPDDNAGGGSICFAFDEPTDVKNLTVLDNEEGGYVCFWDVDGNYMGKMYLPTTCNNEQALAELNVDNVGYMQVTLCGSGAIDNITYDSPIYQDPEGDGYVEGTDGNDVIDATYTGDPHGDMIDANDAILPGEAPQDDIVLAGAGDDTVIAGEGDDDVYAGSGDDYVEGGAGDDTIYGDSDLNGGPGGVTVREKFEWDEAAGYFDGMNAHDFIQNTGNVDVSFSIGGGNRFPDVEWEDASGNVDGIDTGGLGAADQNSGLGLESDANGECVTVNLDFSASVENVEFNINDIDHDSEVWVTAYDADGNEISTQLVGGDDLTVTGNHASSNGGGSSPTDGDYSVQVTIPGPVARVEITHNQDGFHDSHVQVSDVYFDATTPGTGPAGNDTLHGGEGDDTIYGEGGDDIITGGAGNDELHGDGGEPCESDDYFEPSTHDISNVVFYYDTDGDGVYDYSVKVDGFPDSGTAHFISNDLDDFYDQMNDYVTSQNPALVGLEPVVGVSIKAGTDETFYAVDGNSNGSSPDAGPTLNTGPGNDLEIYYSGFYDVYDPTLGGGGSGSNSDSHDDVIDGGDGDDLITGDCGDDTITGGAGADQLFGNDDQDTFIGGNAGDFVDGGEGGVDYDTLDLSGEGPLRVDYDPSNPENGTVTFLDGNGDPAGTMDFVNIENVILPDNNGPDANDDTATTDEDTSVVIDVLDNDTDIDGDPLTVTTATAPNGTVTINPDGTLTYEPDENFNGEDTITYTVDDGNGGTDTATVTVTVNPVNDDPVAEDDTAEVDEDGTVDIPVLDNDTDVDGDPLTVTDADAPNGTVTINPDGTLTYEPDPDFTGEDTITYTVDDGNGGTDTATVTVTVNPVNDGPDAVDDDNATNEDTPINGDVLGNDSDPEGDPLTVTAVNGAPGNVGMVVAGDNGGSFTLNDDGSYDFDPIGAFDDLPVGGSTTTSVTYTVDDGKGGSDTATLTVTVTGVNDAPEAQDDYDTTPFGAPVTINVLGNDTDPDTGDVLSIQGTPTSPDGTVAVNPDGTITFTPNAGFEGVATIDYGVTDGNGGTDTAQVFVTVEDQLLDGIVQGTSGDDLIDYDYTGDPHGDMGDHNDEILPGEGPNDDIIRAFEGDDTIIAGEGNDDIDAGDGDDIVDAGVGDDIVIGGDGSDTVDGGAGDDVIDTSGSDPASDYGWGPIPEDTDKFDDRDTVDGGAGNDTITTGDDQDIITGGEGDDTIDGGLDDDTITGDEGEDLIIGGHGSDTIDGGTGNDEIWGGLGSGTDPFNIVDAIDARPDNGIDVIHGGDGHDTIYGQDDDDILYGDAGDDTIDGGIDEDTIYGGEGSDTLIGGQGDDIIEGGDGADTIDGGTEDDTIDGGRGTDTIYGGAGDDHLDGGSGGDFIDGGEGDDTLLGTSGIDTLLGGDGDDVISAGGEDDTVDGGAGADQIDGGRGNDTLSGGADRDTFTNNNAGDTVDGGAAGDDWDVLDLTGSTEPGGSLKVTHTGPDSNGNGTDGFVTYYDTDGNVTGTLDFTEIEEIVPCFTPGTKIATPKGERLVEELEEGDRVITRDNGIQEIRWVGHKGMDWKALEANKHLKPVLIQAGSLGNGLPERDMLVSPNHRVLVANDRTALYFEEREVLVSAKHLVDNKGIHRVDTMGTTYIHFMFDHHEVVLSDGAWTESFQPGDYSLKGIGNAQRNEIFELFPQLETAEGIEDYTAARRTLKAHEAKMLVK